MESGFVDSWSGVDVESGFVGVLSWLRFEFWTHAMDAIYI